MCLHIGPGLRRHPQRARRTDRQHDHPGDAGLGLAAQDLLWGPVMRTYPDLKIAWSEGGIGWIPFYLDRCDRHYKNQKWLGHDFGGKLPSEVFRDHSLACYVSDPTSLKVRHDIGIDIIAWECDYPHSDSIWPDAPETMMGDGGAGASDDDIHKITWQNTPPLPLRPVHAHRAAGRDGGGAAGALARRRHIDPAAQGGRSCTRTGWRAEEVAPAPGNHGGIDGHAPARGRRGGWWSWSHSWRRHRPAGRPGGRRGILGTGGTAIEATGAGSDAAAENPR